ncbi:hypothetical protein PIB30_078047 [Stylosanthes scabra]|uniref:Uncharacterized protein n=1 Tax=Stylosanthes scabra TaxID=79078 RepID=A0ABU6XNP8_9FABA|nr:hypothetical protein [Stylosanthes scabra]
MEMEMEMEGIGLIRIRVIKIGDQDLDWLAIRLRSEAISFSLSLFFQQNITTTKIESESLSESPSIFHRLRVPPINAVGHQVQTLNNDTVSGMWRIHSYCGVKRTSLGGVSSDSGRKIRIEREVKESMWMSLAATPSVKEGLAAATDYLCRVLTPNALEFSGGLESGLTDLGFLEWVLVHFGNG